MNPRKRCGKKTHGKSYSREYRSWQSMIYRCLNPKSHKYASYGARGIKICERWLTFSEFYADMGDLNRTGLTDSSESFKMA